MRILKEQVRSTDQMKTFHMHYFINLDFEWHKFFFQAISKRFRLEDDEIDNK